MGPSVQVSVRLRRAKPKYVCIWATHQPLRFTIGQRVCFQWVEELTTGSVIGILTDKASEAHLQRILSKRHPKCPITNAR